MRKLVAFLIITLSVAAPIVSADEYVLGPDSERHPGVPQGKITKYSWASKIYPGTVRDYFVYVPAEYKPEKPACIMVFQDGETFINESGAWRTGIVFDNLIFKGDMPVTIGIFINPGVVAPQAPNTQARFDRSYEYDAVGDRFPRFLTEEILPQIGKLYNISSDPNDHAISGSSSGGNASFNAAWSSTECFHRVLSFIGGFTNLRGDHIYPSLVRKMETKPLRVFLQDGLKDVNVYSNYELSLALNDAGYDTKLVIGTEAHNSKHGSAILPDALRWLWRDYPAPIVKPRNGPRHFLTTSVLDSDKDWELISGGYKSADGPAVDSEGNVFFTDAPNNRIHKIDLDGKVTIFKENTGGARGLMFGPGGRLYAGQSNRKRIVSYDPDGKETVIADGVQPQDLAVNIRGEIYFTDSAHKQVWFIGTDNKKRVVYEGIERPMGIRLSPDQAFLLVSDESGRWIWSFLIQADGSLIDGVPFGRLEIPDEVDSGVLRSGAAGMAVDVDGFAYVATKLGIQICDPIGRTVGIINKPQPADPSSVVFGGPGLNMLYTTSGDKVFRRWTRRKGTVSWLAVQPPKPRL